jgi:hypothetical protein
VCVQRRRFLARASPPNTLSHIYNTDFLQVYDHLEIGLLLGALKLLSPSAAIFVTYTTHFWLSFCPHHGFWASLVLLLMLLLLLVAAAAERRCCRPPPPTPPPHPLLLRCRACAVRGRHMKTPRMTRKCMPHRNAAEEDARC